MMVGATLGVFDGSADVGITVGATLGVFDGSADG
jgi:hypothetical protein